MLGRRTPLLACLSIAAFAAFAAAPASAGMYTVWSCRGPAGEPLPAHAWTLSTSEALTSDVSMSDGCVSGGSLVLALTEGVAFPFPARGVATFPAPPGAPIVGFTLWRSIERAPPGTYAFGAATRTKVNESVFADEGCSAATDPCETLGDPGAPLAAENQVEGIQIPIEAVQLWVACETAPCGSPPGVAARLRLFRSRVAIDDLQPPDAPKLSGSLAEGTPVVGPGVLVVESTDVGGGIAASTLSIDGAPVQTRVSSGKDGSCSQPYTLPQPCPAGAAHVFVVNTTALAEGAHTAAGTIVDAGGNETAFGPIAFTVEHPPTAAPPAAPDNGTPAVEAPRLRLDEGRVETRAGRPAYLKGTLSTRDGTPIAGARLAVSTQALGVGGDRLRRLAPVTTSARGRFVARLDGDGASRVTISFAPRAGAAPTRTAVATVRSRASLTLERRPARVRRGEPVVFSGRLRGAGAAALGAVIEIQAIVSGGWRTVATVAAGSGGSFAWRYRFHYVDRRAIFSFRALVRRTPGWPWPPLRSRRIQVHVDG